MPEVHGPENEQEKNGKRNFINEKVVRQPLSRRQLVKRGAAMLCSAAVCGIVAAFSFAAAMPWAERIFQGPEKEPSHISIPKDTMEPTAPPESQEPSEAETPQEPPIEEKVQSVMENYHYTAEDFTSMVSSLRAQAMNANRGIVVVHSVQQEVDWFDNELETSGAYAGAVIAATDQELLILTPCQAAENDSIRVTFGNGQDVNARMKQKDMVSGVAVVSVDVSLLDESVVQSLEPVPLGNSYIVREGDLLIAVGAPAGAVYSIDYGAVSYIQKNVQMTDQSSRLMYVDILSDAEKGTFFLNTSGELVGWAVNPEREAAGQKGSVATMLGISDRKGILERLSNGLGAPLVGILGQTVPESLTAQGRPAGVYVVNVVPDSPAYGAGIQSGDVITAIDGKQILTMREYQSLVESLECGQVIHITVERNGISQYAELEFQVTTGAR